MIKVCLHHDGTGASGRLSVQDISDLVRDAEALIWVDVVDPSPEELNLLGEEFGFHHLAIEDALRRHQRPKLDQYEGFQFIFFYALGTDHDRPTTQEIDFFVGPNYLVTVHHGPLPPFQEMERRWRENPLLRDQRSVGFLVYALLDAIVDGYFPVIDAIAERVDDLEDAIFRGAQRETQATIFRLKKDLLGVRRVVAPERDVMNVLVRRDSPIFGEQVVIYFQDVYDHILRVTDAVDTYRDVLSSALDANLSVTSYRLNEVVKRLTSFSIILMSVTLIAGIYGMNFEYMPELGWPLGYPWALGLMLAIAGSLVLFFRRIDWL